MSNRTVVAWRRLGYGFVVSAVALGILVFGAIALDSAPASNQTSKASLLGFDPTGQHRAATLTPAPTPVVTPAPTPAPTAEPTTELAPPEAVAPAPTEAPAPIPQPAALPTPAPPAHGYRYDMANEIFGLLNYVRTQQGLSAVSGHGILTATAEYYTKLHFTTADPYQLNHYLDGGPGSRAWNRGYSGGAVGEILVTSQGSAQGMVDLWMNSPSHRAVIMDPQYTQIGVACYGGEYRSADGSIGYPILCAAEFGSGG